MKEKMAQLFKNKKALAVLSIVFVAILVVVLSNSYALFQRQLAVGNANLQVGELQYSMSSTSLNENNAITVEAGKSITFDITITSLNDISSKYELYYNSDSNDVTVGYLTTTVDPAVGETTKNETKTISVKIINNSSTSQTIVFGVEGGFLNSELILTKGKKLVELEDDISVSEKVFLSENLGESCKTYDDGVDTFLVGKCSQNYVWYSGKLWRVVLKNNETGAVKMITDNEITAIPYNKEGNSNFENSYADQWLSQEFLSTLHDYQDYLVIDSVWDATVSSSKRPAGTTLVNRTVGLLNNYEYYVTYGQSGGLATSSTTYLTNGIYWWFLTPNSSSAVRVGSFNGYVEIVESKIAHGVRPSVNLKSDIRIISGNGTQTEPYRLAGDSQETINGILLSTRYSGEYIKFNNELYRIVGAEEVGNEILTKITTVDKPNALVSNKFHSAKGVAIFTNASIKSDLQSYYVNNIADPYKSMIAENQIWYLGAVGVGENYKASICTSVDVDTNIKTCAKTVTKVTATIGLPRVGEMFTSQITRGERQNFWTLTPIDTEYVRLMCSDGYLGGSGIFNSMRTEGARPSMYLKSTVKISSSNTGDGTYEHPYDIELGS